MPKYPTRRAEKDALYNATVAGIAANPALYPSGPGQPFATGTLSGLITTKNTAVNTQQQEEGQFRAATAAANGAYDDCDDEERRLLNLAIATHGADSPHLLLIGSGPRSAPQSNIPGQARNLEAIVQGPGDCFLDWKAPAPGGGVGGGVGGEGGEAPPGAVAFYKVQRRKRTLQGQQTEDWGAWQATTTDTEITLLGLERGVEYDFRVVASNSTGDALPSNVVTVVL
ncbi:MAG: fibronectin type III domain-containing protein [Fimbriimonadaceae bacterium]|nr:fibronectin type III domain-containing protein [Fimbriimonadaceae bacterium]